MNSIPRSERDDRPDQNFDLLIKGGAVYDGEADRLYTADVGVRDGRIAAVGQLSGRAENVILARDRLVALGSSTSTPTATTPSATTASGRTIQTSTRFGRAT